MLGSERVQDCAIPILYTKAIKLIFREGHYAMRKYMAGHWPIYTFLAFM
jgi:hypothetical protein